MAPETPTGTSTRTRAQTIPLHPCLIMQTPSTTQLHTAIEVLKRYGEHINHNAENMVVQLPDTHFGNRFASRIKVLNIEQVTRIQTVVAQLEKWRDELLQQKRHCISHHV
jgi:hypothetical protein